TDADGIRKVEPAGIEPASIGGLSGLLRAEPVVAFLGPGSLTGTLLTGPATLVSRRALWPCSTVDPPNDVLPGRRRSRVDRSHYLIRRSGGEAVSGLRLQLRLVGSYFLCSVWLTRSSLLPRP